jgi:hypothetical protein
MTYKVVAKGKNNSWTLAWPSSSWRMLSPDEREAVVERQRQLLEGVANGKGIRRNKKKSDR